MEEAHLIAAQKAMNECGIAVLRVEMYGHGKSDGEFKNHTLYKWITNALMVVKYARSLDFVTDLYLAGHSQGGLLTVLMLIHGDADEAVPYADSVKAQKLYKNAKLVTIEGDDHCFTKHVDKMAQAIKDFFKTL